MSGDTSRAPDGLGAPSSRLGDGVADADWPASIADLRDGFAGRLNVYRTMAHHPALLRAWAPLRAHLVLDSALAADLREVVILRVGHVWGSGYEWAHHVVRARLAGLDEARIERARRDLADWPPGDTDALLMSAVDALLEAGRIAVPLLDALVQRLGGAAVLDLMATVGMYSTLAFVTGSLDTPLDADIRAALDRSPLEPGGKR